MGAEESNGTNKNGAKEVNKEEEEEEENDYGDENEDELEELREKGLLPKPVEEKPPELEPPPPQIPKKRKFKRKIRRISQNSPLPVIQENDNEDVNNENRRKHANKGNISVPKIEKVDLLASNNSNQNSLNNSQEIKSSQKITNNSKIAQSNQKAINKNSNSPNKTKVTEKEAKNTTNAKNINIPKEIKKVDKNPISKNAKNEPKNQAKNDGKNTPKKEAPKDSKNTFQKEIQKSPVSCRIPQPQPQQEIKNKDSANQSLSNISPILENPHTKVSHDIPLSKIETFTKEKPTPLTKSNDENEPDTPKFSPTNNKKSQFSFPNVTSENEKNFEIPQDEVSLYGSEITDEEIKSDNEIIEDNHEYYTMDKESQYPPSKNESNGSEIYSLHNEVFIIDFNNTKTTNYKNSNSKVMQNEKAIPNLTPNHNENITEINKAENLKSSVLQKEAINEKQESHEEIINEKPKKEIMLETPKSVKSQKEIILEKQKLRELKKKLNSINLHLPGTEIDIAPAKQKSANSQKIILHESKLLSCSQISKLPEKSESSELHNNAIQENIKISELPNDVPLDKTRLEEVQNQPINISIIPNENNKKPDSENEEEKSENEDESEDYDGIYDRKSESQYPPSQNLTEGSEVFSFHNEAFVFQKQSGPVTPKNMNISKISIENTQSKILNNNAIDQIHDNNTISQIQNKSIDTQITNNITTEISSNNISGKIINNEVVSKNANNVNETQNINNTMQNVAESIKCNMTPKINEPQKESEIIDRPTPKEFRYMYQFGDRIHEPSIKKSPFREPKCEVVNKNTTIVKPNYWAIKNTDIKIVNSPDYYSYKNFKSEPEHYDLLNENESKNALQNTNFVILSTNNKKMPEESNFSYFPVIQRKKHISEKSPINLNRSNISSIPRERFISKFIKDCSQWRVEYENTKVAKLREKINHKQNKTMIIGETQVLRRDPNEYKYYQTKKTQNNLDFNNSKIENSINKPIESRNNKTHYCDTDTKLASKLISKAANRLYDLIEEKNEPHIKTPQITKRSESPMIVFMAPDLSQKTKSTLFKKNFRTLKLPSLQSQGVN